MATYDLAYPGAAIDAILNTAYFLQEAGYIFRGSASEYSGTPSKRVWLIAPAGFTGYGISSPVPQGSIGICLYNGTSWVGKIINVATIDSTPTQNSGNAVSSGGAYAAINQLSASVTEALDNLTFTDTTPSAFQDEYINMKVSTTEGGVERILTFLTILAATTSKAGLLSAEDKVKIDSFLTNLRSLTFADTTASADQGTQITETLKATIGGVQEVIDSITLLAATSSKAGLLSASDKAYIDALPATLTNLSNSISGALALMQSMMGYYVCDTAAGTAAKTVAATGYSLTNGGCIRIKMTNANTADNATLNINSTGAKALYYDGAQASATNTWEAGEVLEVYYDGTQYQCASGGGGKFASGEYVKDTSITDEITPNSDALVTSGAVFNTIGGYVDIDLSNLTSQVCSLGGSKKWYRNGASGPQRHIALPVTAGLKYKLSASSSGTLGWYAWCTSSYSPPYSSSQAVPMVASESDRLSIDVGETIIVEAPTDAAYLIMTTVDGAGLSVSWTVKLASDLGNLKFKTGEVLGNTGIDGALTQFSKNLAKSGVVWEELHKAGYYNELIDISGISEAPCSLGSTFWYMSNSNNQRHKAIPIIAGQYYKIKGTSANGTASALWATITSAYNPVKNTDVNFTSNETQRNVTPSGEYVTFQAPQDAAYLILTTVDGGGISCTWEVTFISQCYKDVNTLAEDVESFEQGLTIRHPFDTTNATIWNYFINASDSIWKQSSTYRCKIIRVEMYRGMKIVATKNANAATIRFAFITSWPVKDTPVIYSVGTTLVNTPVNEVTMTVPEDCIWLYLYADSDGTNVEPSVVFIESGIAPIYKELFSKESVVDISGYTEQNCSLGSSNWYMSSSNKQRHIAIPVTAGDIYAIIPNVGSFYGFVSSDYTPPYTNNQPIPYVSGGRRRLYGGESAAIKIPSNCAYLILNTVSGDDVQCTWKMMSGSLSSTLQTPTAFAKLRVCSWNIGHFALGTSYDTLITRADYPEKRIRWANRINELDADVMMCCEYNTYVVNAEGNNPPIIASETIFEPFQYSYVGSKPSATSYMQLAIFSPKPLKDVEEVVFPNTTQAGRYYMVGTMKINNIDVKLVGIHLDWNQGETGEANRQLQKQKLVEDFANDEYVIICGDFNTNNGASEFDIFANAGYEMADHGYIGDFPTYPAGNEPVQYLDNILCKGFKISGVHIINDSELTDHCAVYADLTMIEPIKKAES